MSSATQSPQSTDIERYEPKPYVPPAPAVALLLAATFGAAGAFAWAGIERGLAGRADLTKVLLDVSEPKSALVDFELKDMKGNTVRLADLKDKTVFLNFWATWCPPCVEEMPSLRRLHQKLADHPDFVFLAVSTDEEWSVVRRFFAHQPAAFPILLDAQGQVAKRYGTTKFPETYIIQNGRLVGHIIGPRDWDRWYAEGWLRELLKDQGRT